MTMFDRIGDVLRAAGVALAEALSGRVTGTCSRGFGLTIPDEVPGIMPGRRVAGSPGRRVAGSPGRRVAGSPGRRVAGSPNLRPQHGAALAR